MAAASIIVDIIAKTGSFVTDTKRAENQLKSLKKEIQGSKLATDQAYDSFQKTGASLKSLASITFGALGADFIINATDAYAKFTSQLKLATSSQAEFAGAYDSVVRISRTTQGDIESIGNLYARLARATKEAGVEQSQIAVFTETVSAALRVSNATAKETASVMLQLSQAFGAGRLNGQEFAAIAEGAPILLERLSKSLGKPVGALKELGAQGKITREELLKAFTDKAFLTSLQQQVKEVGTIGSAFQVFRNELTLYIGEADKANGASKALREGVLALAKNLDTIANVALVAVTVGLGRYVAGKGAALNATLAEIAAEQASIASKQKLALANYTVAEAQLAAQIATSKSTLSLANNAALTTATSVARSNLAKAEAGLAAATATSSAAMSVFGRAIGFLGGPLGALVTTLSLGALAFADFGDEAESSAIKVGTAISALEKYNQLQKQQRQFSSGNNPILEDLDKASKAYSEILSKIGTVDSTTGTVFTKDNPAIKKAKDDLEQITSLYKKAQKEFGLAPVVNINTEAFDKLNSKLRTARNITEDYRKAVADYTREGFKAGISQDVMKEGLVELEKQYKKDLESLEKQSGGLKKSSKARAESASESQKFIDSLIRQEKTIGLNEIGLLKYEQSLLPLTSSQKIFTDSLIESIDALTKQSDIIEKTKSLNEQFLPVQDKFNKEYAEYLGLLNQGRLTQDAYNGKVKELLKNYEDTSPELVKLRQEQEQFNKTIESTDTKQLEKTREEVAKIYEEFYGNFDSPLFTEAINEALGRTAEKTEKTTDFMEAAFKRAAENIQDALADFLFDPFKDGVDGMLLNFINVLRRMASEALAAEILKKVFDVDKSKDLSESIYTVFDGLFSKIKNLFGGIDFGKIFSGFSGGNPFASIGNFFGGFFANGGDPPLNKISVVGERGPELFVPRTAGTIIPNNMLGMGNQQPTNLSVKNINVLDPSLVGQYLRTDDGERVIMNVIQRNRRSLGV